MSSRAERRRQRREGGGGATGGSRGKKMHPAWIPAGFVVAAFVILGVISQVSGTGGHPEVRAAEDRPMLMAPERYAQYVRAESTYEIAHAIPDLLDGIYCHCDCEIHAGHHSLLDCFASDHAAACDICMREAEIAYELSQRGAGLGEIRAEIDRMYGT